MRLYEIQYSKMFAGIEDGSEWVTSQAEAAKARAGLRKKRWKIVKTVEHDIKLNKTGVVELLNKLHNK